MGLRFRKSLTLAPGIRMNFSGSGTSWSIGPRGASIGIGQRGAFFNAGIPGTGISSRSKIGGESGGGARAAKLQTTVGVTVGVTDEGEVYFKDESGKPAPESWVKAAKRQQGEFIKGLIQKKCDEINEGVEALGRTHKETPWPVPHVASQ